jgi:parvulin-like peptidyl-prolyl isomerase
MKRSLALAAAVLAAVTMVAAGCGGSDEVPADSVAVVDGSSITRSSLDDLLARAKKSYTAQKRAFPKAGTSDYQALQTQAVAYLVQRQEYASEADKLGVTVTEAQIAKKIDGVRKQYFGGDQKKFEKGSPTRATPRPASAKRSARSSPRGSTRRSPAT